MMLNLRPRDLGLLDCIVEECDLRFSEVEMEGMLRAVGEICVEDEDGGVGSGGGGGLDDSVSGAG